MGTRIFEQVGIWCDNFLEELLQRLTPEGQPEETKEKTAYFLSEADILVKVRWQVTKSYFEFQERGKCEISIIEIDGESVPEENQKKKAVTCEFWGDNPPAPEEQKKMFEKVLKNFGMKRCRSVTAGYAEGHIRLLQLKQS